MILIKVALTIAIVTILSIVAERVSPRVAGILSGYPLGSAIALFFIGLEQGAAFAATSAVYNIAGLAALLSFFFIYYRMSARGTGSDRLPGRLSGILAASIAALAGFFAVDALLHALPLPGWACALVGAGGILGYSFLFRTIPNIRIGQKIQLGPGVILFRAGLAALTILAITGAANLVPPSWAGLFSAFPITAFPLVLIIHSTYGPAQAHSIIKNIPTGLWALVLYLLTIAFAYPRLGIAWGTLAGFGVATAYLLGLSVIHGNNRSR